MRADTSISSALNSAFEMSTRPGLYFLAKEPFMQRPCPKTTSEEPGLLCTSVYGVASRVDVDTELTGRLNTYPRGLYNAPPLPQEVEAVASPDDYAFPPTSHKARGSMRGIYLGPAPVRMGPEWLAGIDMQKTSHFMREDTGLVRNGEDARLLAKDSFTG